MIKYLKYFSILIIISLIRVYQYFISPLLKNNCRYLPTCSEYSIEAFKEYGLLKGFYYSVNRISRCHPFGGKGFDPLPKKNNIKIKRI